MSELTKKIQNIEKEVEKEFERAVEGVWRGMQKVVTSGGEVYPEILVFTTTEPVRMSLTNCETPEDRAELAGQFGRELGRQQKGILFAILVTEGWFTKIKLTAKQKKMSKDKIIELLAKEERPSKSADKKEGLILSGLCLTRKTAFKFSKINRGKTVKLIDQELDQEQADNILPNLFNGYAKSFTQTFEEKHGI